ncbi:ATP-grasp domain-containing protein [Rhizobium mongolense]|uniref:ATP-grasp domain-containing protein n=1 Tax=Rhizobium mongolense TaxID=57676 RepID=UPI0035575105
MGNRALIMIEGHRRIGLLFIQAAQRLGLHPITLSADPARYPYLAAESLENVHVDTDSLDALIHECSRLSKTYEIAGITAAEEEVYATVGKLCEHFDLPGPNAASVERCCDKFAQRQLLAEAGIPIPIYRLAANETEVKSFAAEIGLPVIVKPAVGTGSSGVRLCRNLDALAEHTTYLLGGKHKWTSLPRILVEEFARGPFYSVDTMEKEIIGVCTADFDRPPHFVFSRCTYPAPLTDDEYKCITEVSLNCLRALGLGWGPTTIELRWTIGGPVVVEVNPRLAGGTNPRLIKLAYGVDLITELIKLVTGNECDLRKKQSQTAGSRHLVPERDGILDWIDGHSRAAAVPGVDQVGCYVKAKTPIARNFDYLDSIGHVIAASPSPALTEATLQHAVELISWSITPFSTLDEQELRSAGSHPPASVDASTR